MLTMTKGPACGRPMPFTLAIGNEGTLAVNNGGAALVVDSDGATQGIQRGLQRGV